MALVTKSTAARVGYEYVKDVDPLTFEPIVGSASISNINPAVTGEAIKAVFTGLTTGGAYRTGVLNVMGYSDDAEDPLTSYIPFSITRVEKYRDYFNE